MGLIFIRLLIHLAPIRVIAIFAGIRVHSAHTSAVAATCFPSRRHTGFTGIGRPVSARINRFMPRAANPPFILVHWHVMKHGVAYETRLVFRLGGVVTRTRRRVIHCRGQSLRMTHPRQQPRDVARRRDPASHGHGARNKIRGKTPFANSLPHSHQHTHLHMRCVPSQSWRVRRWRLPVRESVLRQPCLFVAFWRGTLCVCAQQDRVVGVAACVFALLPGRRCR